MKSVFPIRAVIRSGLLVHRIAVLHYTFQMPCQALQERLLTLVHRLGSIGFQII